MRMGIRIVNIVLILVTVYQLQETTGSNSSTSVSSHFIQLVDDILTNHVGECDSIFVPGEDIEGTFKELEMLNMLKSHPHIYLSPKHHVFNYKVLPFRFCYVTIIWTNTSRSLLDVINKLQKSDLLLYHQFYIIYVESYNYQAQNYKIPTEWSFLKKIPKSLLLESKKGLNKISGQFQHKFGALKYNQFFSPTIFQKVLNFQTDFNLLFENFYKSFNGISLRVTILQYFPYTIIQPGEHGTMSYSGAELKILNVLMQQLNFRVTFYSPDDGRWGSRNLETGEWDGMILEIMLDKADVALGGIVGTYDRNQVIDYVKSYSRECLTFITPQAKELPKWMVLEIAFEWEVWIGVILSLILAPFVLNFVTKKVSLFTIENEYFHNMPNAIFTVSRFIFQISPEEEPLHTSTRIFVASLWIFTVIVTVAYRSMLTSLLSVPMFEQPIDTLHELALSDLTPNMYNYGGSWTAMLKSSSDPDYQEIWRRMEFIISIPKAVKRVEETENFAVMDSHTTLKLLLVTEYTDPISGISSVHLMKECFGEYGPSFVVQKRSPYKSTLDRVTGLLVATGLVNKWFNDEIESKKFDAVKKKLKEGVTFVENKEQPLTLNHLQGGFLCYALGVGLGFISLLIEVFIRLYYRLKLRETFRKVHNTTRVAKALGGRDEFLRREEKNGINHGDMPMYAGVINNK